MFDHAQILGIENIRSPLIFVNRHIFARPGFLHNAVFPAAGMGTGSLIGIPACEKIAEQAAAGIRNTHGPMDKTLYFHIIRNPAADFLYLL